MKHLGITVGSILAGVSAGILIDEHFWGNNRSRENAKLSDELGKSREFYYILLQWIRVHQEGRELKNYFVKNGFRTVAIYGMKELGEALLDELRDTEVEVKYGIDRDADAIYSDVDVFKPDELLEETDVVVVTAVHYYDEIEKMLSGKVKSRIVSIEDVVWEA